jgi:purine catabolism regulator
MMHNSQMPTLSALAETAGHALVPVTPFPPSRLVSGVHVSELAAPGRYLAGGELLLTTGIPLTGRESDEEYVASLAAHDVGALGLGLGEGWDAPPPGFADRCARAGVPLFVVPDAVPFLDVSRALVTLERRVERDAGIRAASAHTRLAEAAAGDDGRAGVVRAIAEAVGGWAAWVPAGPSEDAALLHPPALAGLLPSVVADIDASLGRSGAGAASFSADGSVALALPVSDGSGRIGALAIGAGRPLTPADRQLARTAIALLRSLAAPPPAVGPASAGPWIVRLALDGRADAARALAHSSGIELPPVVRVHIGDLESEPLPLSVVDGSRRITLRSGLDVPTAGAASAPVAWEDVPAAADRALALWLDVRADDPGAVPAVVEPDDRAGVWLDALAPTPGLREAVRAHLAGGLRVEQTARSLGVHRNTARQRIAAAERAMGVVLTDPDVAAELWMTLRRVSR